MHAGDEAQTGHVLDGLMRRAVFTKADRVMREDVDDALLHEGGHAQGVAGIVGERQERGGVRNETAVERNAVHDGGHAELTDAVADVAGKEVAAVKRLDAGPVREVRARQVGGTAEQFGKRGRKSVEGLLAGLTGGDGLGSLFGGAEGVHHGVGPVFGQVAGEAALEFCGELGILGGIAVEHRLPFGFDAGAFGTVIPGVIDLLRNLERSVGPTDRGAGGGDFLIAERFTVDLGGTLTVGRALADGGARDDEGGLILGELGLGDGGVHGVDVMAVDRADHVPAVGFEAAARVVAEPALDVTVDRNAVVVVDGDELVELPDAGERADFVADALHHAAVA